MTFKLITKPFSTSHKTKIRKAVLYILENYNRQTPSQGKNHKKEKNKKEGEREKNGRRGIIEGTGL